MKYLLFVTCLLISFGLGWQLHKPRTVTITNGGFNLQEALNKGGITIVNKNQVIDANSYSQGYAYGKKTGNSYLAPLPPQSKFNAGADQAVKDSTK